MQPAVHGCTWTHGRVCGGRRVGFQQHRYRRCARRAATNGLAVSPRERIKDEVLEAYRTAGNCSVPKRGALLLSPANEGPVLTTILTTIVPRSG
jgi:hypothetical protein